jgi:hypothetical protein
MDGFSGSAASRRLWSKALQKKANDRLQRRDPAVALPALVRRPSGQQPDASRTPLHAFLAAQLDANDRESYSRSQLRAMASSKLQPSSSNNLASSSRAHSTERLAPLDPASFERARTQQRRPLPGPLQAAINQVLAVRNCDERPNAREDRCGGTNNDSDEPAVIPRARRSSPCKKQLYGRRPEWRRYIRRIMMTNGIRGSTLARYRRLVGIVARKSLAQSFADAAERVVSYRLESRSATRIQRAALRFLVRRRQATLQRRHRAAARIQSVWSKVLETEKQRELAVQARQATIERLTRARAARVVQRSYRDYRRVCRLREGERRQQQHASMLQRARLKLLKRYQSWRQNATKEQHEHAEVAASSTPQTTSPKLGSWEENSSGGPDATSPQAASGNAEVVGTSLSNALVCTEARPISVDAPRQELRYARGSAASSSPSLGNNEAPAGESEVRIEDGTLRSLGQTPEKGDTADLCAVASPVGGSQLAGEREYSHPPADQDPVSLTESCERATKESTLSSCSRTEQRGDVDSSGSSADTDEGGSAPLSSPAELPHQCETLIAAVAYTSAAESTTVAAAVAGITRNTAAGRIARCLVPKAKARHKSKTNAAIQLQCLTRSRLARQCMARIRLEALRSLREQLRASWKRSVFQPHSSASLDSRKEQDGQGPERDDEDEEWDLEVGGCQISLPGASDAYLHLLPTRNGQIPPGVPLLQASAGAPALSLWKWSWPDEQWLNSNQ